MKNYPPQFRADAVALYQSRPEATIRQVAADLGINPETLRNWVRAAGASRPRGRRAEAPAEPPTPLECGERRSAAKGSRAGGGTRDPAQGGEVFRRGDALVNRFQFVADHQRRYGVKRLCAILGIARSSF
ncbi:transposase, partial [Streptomyces swartbergensis]